ncbi:polysaccharide biosynthesis/export family protein [Cognatishimia sp. 1_MG-2023]|uniref:polysaccharide biosynthesis/export family protein n=1 Tax=Cognatishimia sp. 1_MG-2023 TaxID=3062642 RepID=UPI0034A40C01
MCRRAGGSPRGLGSLPAAPEAQIQPAPGALALRLPPAAEHPIYQIGIGDVILLATRASGRAVEQVSGVFAAQSQQQGYTVRDDGAISIPEVGSVTVQGLTIEEAEERVFQRLIQSQFDAEFSLEIAEFKSKRVTIGGAVGTSTLVPVTLTPLTLDQALASAGGIALANQDFGSIRIYRGGELYQIPLETYFKDSKARKLVLLDGDSVYVDNAYDLERAQEFYERQIETLELKQRSRLNAISELQSEIDLRRSELNEQRSNFQSKVDLGAVDRDYVYLTGEVANQNRIPLPFETKASLADVFYENGGFPTTTGDPSQIYVLRANNTEELTAYHLNAKNIVNLTVATKFEMRPDDIIFVREQPITVWGRALQQAFPALISAGATSLE